MFPSLPQLQRKRLITKEIIIVVGTVMVLLLLFGVLSYIFPSFQGIAATAIAITFIYSPLVVAKKTRTNPSSLGLNLGKLMPSIVWTTAVILVIFPLFSVGYFVYYNASFCPSVKRLYDWPMSIPKIEPAQLSKCKSLCLTRIGSQLLLLNRSTSTKTVTVHWKSNNKKYAPSKIKFYKHSFEVVESVRSTGKVKLGIKHGLSFYPPSQFSFVSIKSSFPMQLLLTNKRVKRVFARPSLAWLWWAILFHLLVASIPEEIFYRGYLQTRLTHILPQPRFSILGVRNLWAILLSSLLFALGHLATQPNPARLAVFFPSLLFGWIREKSGGLLAPIAVHLLSNLLMLFLSKFAC